MSDIQNQPTNNGQRKQFYTLNLTPERIFIIFVLFVVVIAAIIIAVSFSLSKNASAEFTGSEYDFLNDITNADYDYNKALTNNQNPVTDIFDKTEVSAAEVIAEPITQENQNIVIQTEVMKKQPTVVVNNDKVVYSSTLVTEKEVVPVKTAYKEPAKANVVVKKVEVKPVDAKPVVTKAAVKKAVSEKYVIQIASYSNEKSLESVSSFYKNAGYPVYTKSFIKDGATYYRLRIGPYDEKVKADQFLAAIKQSKYGKDSFISVGYY